MLYTKLYKGIKKEKKNLKKKKKFRPTYPIFLWLETGNKPLFFFWPNDTVSKYLHNDTVSKFYFHSLGDCGSSKLYLSVCLFVCLSVCLSVCPALKVYVSATMSRILMKLGGSVVT